MIIYYIYLKPCDPIQYNCINLKLMSRSPKKNLRTGDLGINIDDVPWELLLF